MKRTLSMALVLGLITASAFAAEVTSVNTVGYQNLDTVTATYKMAGVGFTTVTDPSTPLNINDALVGNYQAGDKVLFFNGTSYETILYSSDLLDDFFVPTGQPGWASGTGQASTRVINPGESFWIQSAANAAATRSGEVRATAPTLSTVAGQYKILTSPYPADVALNDIGMSGMAAGDKVLFFNGASYQTILYSADLLDEFFVPTGQPGWASGTGQASDKVVTSGEAFWILSAGAGTVDFPTVLP